jgi:adenosine deaminase
MITINTDDPAYFTSRYLNDVLVGLAKAVDLTETEVIQLVRYAFEGAWLPATDRDGYLSMLEAFVAERGTSA